MVKENLEEVKEKLSKIKLFVLDCDGVLTDGGIYLDSSGKSFRRFDVKDGLGIKLLHEARINVACISGSNSSILTKRATSLDIKIIRKGIADKLNEIRIIQKDLGLKSYQTIFLGDDINDLKVLPAVSIFAVPYDAHKACKEKASLIGESKGGNGFVREIIDKTLLAQGLDPFAPLAIKNGSDI